VVALGTAAPAFADDVSSALTDPSGASTQALMQAVVASTMPTPTASAAPPAPAPDAVANAAPAPPRNVRR